MNHEVDTKKIIYFEISKRKYEVLQQFLWTILIMKVLLIYLFQKALSKPMFQTY